MATNFPSALDNGTSLPYPTAGSFTNSPSLAGINDNQNDAIIATQTKIGTGASVAASGKLLRGTGAGTSAWDKDAPTGTIVGTTDTQVLTNKTLTSPTINSPTISNATITTDTITGYTVANTGTVYGISVSSAKINGSFLTDSSVTSSKLAPTRSTDANSWIVFDYGTWKIYSKRVTFSQSIGGLAFLTISSNNLPVGLSDLSTVNFQYSFVANAQAGVLNITFEGGATSPSLSFTTSTNDGASRTFTGFIDILLTKVS